MKKLILSAIIILTISTCKAQCIIGASLEYSTTYKQPGAGIFGGYQFGNSYAGIDTHFYMGRVRKIPSTINFEYGYTIGKFQPFISYGFYTCGGEAQREGEGAQGFEYGVGINYNIGEHIKVGASITQTNSFISIKIL